MPLATKRQQGRRYTSRQLGAGYSWHRLQGGPDYSIAAAKLVGGVRTPPAPVQAPVAPLHLFSLSDLLSASILLDEPIPRAKRYEYLQFPKQSKLVTIELFGESEWVASLPEAHIFADGERPEHAKQNLLRKCRRDLQFLRRNKETLGSLLQQKLAILHALF